MNSVDTELRLYMAKLISRIVKNDTIVQNKIKLLCNFTGT